MTDNFSRSDSYFTNGETFSEEFLSWDANLTKLHEEHFSRLKGRVYVDHAGATLYSEIFMDNWLTSAKKNLFCNPHSHSETSLRTTESINNIRNLILRYFNTTPATYDVVFTGNCTAALKLVAESYVFHGSSSDNEYNSVRNVNGSHLKKCDECGVLAYINDNHTSVIGMRNVINERRADFLCVTASQVEESLLIDLQSSHHENDYSTEFNRSCNNLFVYPAQSNFSGQRYPLSWISRVRRSDRLFNRCGHWCVLLDAASYLTTTPLDLGAYQPDFVTLSFYKMFGFPTGIGALLVNKESGYLLEKQYFGGGTIEMSLSDRPVHSFRKPINERLEDGTLPFLEIMGLQYGFDMINYIGSVCPISQHSFVLTQYVYRQLSSLTHYNGVKLACIYSGGSFSSPDEQGPIINFNLRTSTGSFIGFSQVERLAEHYRIDLRTGCFCNIGACQQHLKLSTEQILNNFKAGHICGDSMDIIEGLPTGSVRVSFGLSSTLADVNKLLQFITECFLEQITPPPTTNTETVERLNLEPDILLKIFIYPVKSGGSVEVPGSRVTSRGLQYDRQWMIINESGHCVTQKRLPGMCRIVPRIDELTDSLTLTYPGARDLTLPLTHHHAVDRDVRLCCGRVCTDSISCYDCGDEAALWCQQVLDKSGLRLLRQASHDCRLVTSAQNLKPTMEGAAERSCTPRNNAQVNLSLANEAQYLLITSASLNSLLDVIERRAKESGTVAISLEELIARFRPNFVVKTVEPFIETSWLHVKIGNFTFVNQGPCTRCQMISVDQGMGERSVEPLRSLSTLPHLKNRFGILLSSLQDENRAGEAAAGDERFVNCELSTDVLCVGDVVRAEF